MPSFADGREESFVLSSNCRRTDVRLHSASMARKWWREQAVTAGLSKRTH